MTPKIAILKADDFGHIPSDNFRRLMELGRKWQVPIAIGIVGGSLSVMSKSEISYFRACFEDDLLEAWNHSASHFNLTTLSRDEQLKDIQLAQSQIHEKLGVLCSTFGAPYNKYNNDTIDAIQAIPEFKGVYLVDDAVAASVRIVNIPRKSLVSPEFVRPWSRDNNFNEFVRRFNLKKSQNLLTVQFHPGAWNDYSFSEFERCLEYMLNQGFRFLNFSEYIEMLGVEHEHERSARVRAIEIDAALEISSQKMKERYSKDARLSDFFFNRQVVGIQHVIRSLKRVTFGEPPGSNQNADHSILDLGCGVGNWLIGYGLLHPSARLFGLDKLEPCVELTKASLTAAGMLDRSSVLVGSGDDITTSFPQRFSRILCLNAAQYMEKERFFRFAHRALEHLGLFLLSIQTPEYFMGAAWSYLESSDPKFDEAWKRLEIIIESLARHLGVRRRDYNVHVYDEREIMFMAQQNGFDALVAGIEFEKPNPGIRGFPFQRTYLFENRFLVEDQDNGYGSFMSMPEDKRSKHLNDLRAYGAWMRLRELLEHCSDAIPQAMKSDLTALSHSTISDASLVSNSDHSEFVKKILAINSKKYSIDQIFLSKGNDPLVDILYPLVCYFSEDYLKVLDFCQSINIEKDFDPKVFVLAAAAACRLGRGNDAKDFLEKFMVHRGGMLQ